MGEVCSISHRKMVLLLDWWYWALLKFPNQRKSLCIFGGLLIQESFPFNTLRLMLLCYLQPNDQLIVLTSFQGQDTLCYLQSVLFVKYNKDNKDMFTQASWKSPLNNLPKTFWLDLLSPFRKWVSCHFRMLNLIPSATQKIFVSKEGRFPWGRRKKNKKNIGKSKRVFSAHIYLLGFCRHAAAGMTNVIWILLYALKQTRNSEKIW